MIGGYMNWVDEKEQATCVVELLGVQICTLYVL